MFPMRTMIFEKVKSDGLAHISYLLGSERGAAVIDPRRDCEIYLEIARENNLEIRYILETHRNEDYVIGSTALQRDVDAEVLHGPGLDFGYGKTVEDGEKIEVGELTVEAMHTPGHTDESMSYALSDRSTDGEPIMVFTGDALFVGDVGRTDLYGPDEAERLATDLYHSLFERILPLGDEVILCPAHGGGSVCGGSISEREESTLGLERAHNPKLQLEKEEFIDYKSRETLPVPPYFKMMERYNLQGPPAVDPPRPQPINPEKVAELQGQGAVVVDTRLPGAFSAAHIPNSYNIWTGGLPLYSGWVLPYDEPILLVLEDAAKMDTVSSYLFRLGYDNLNGYLCSGPQSCGLEAWYSQGNGFESVAIVSARQLEGKIGSGLNVLDVRGEDEYRGGHIAGASNIHVGHLEERVHEVDSERPVVTVCGVGTRSSMAASILKRAGHDDVSLLLGGMMAWNKLGLPVEAHSQD
jgi:hydroxyacylglutathione hydrolase